MALLGVILLTYSPWSVASPPSGFGYVRQITIDHRQVANTDQTDFPVLISVTLPDLAIVGNGGSVQSSNGYDIIFTSDAAGTSQLDHEIDSYNPTTGAAGFWVRIPTLSHTTDTPIYMWYGNSAVTTSQENKPGVWRNGYAAVYHLGNGGTNVSASDSLGASNGTSIGVSNATGVIGGAGQFAGSSSSYIKLPNSTTLKPTSALTLEGWVNPASIGTWDHIFALDYNSNGSWASPTLAYALSTPTANPSLEIAVNNQFTNLAATGSLPVNRWTHLVGTYDGSVMRLYLNGIQDANSLNAPGTIGYGTSKEVVIGKATLYASAIEAWNGLLDELRISSVARSADWIATEYNNQNSPSSFFIVCGQTVSGNQLPSCSTQIPTSSFSFVRQIQIDHRRVANSDQTDFPVLVPSTIPDLATVANGGEVQNVNGYDIVFTSDTAGQNRLDHEIDSYDPITGNAAFWVRIPTLSHTTDTTLYMWYGSSAVGPSQENKPGVWRNGYAAVYHLSGGGNVSAFDSLGANNGTPVGVSSASGVIGGAGQFAGSSSSYIKLPNSTTLKPSSALTLEGWVNPSSVNGWNKIFALDYNSNGSWALPTLAYALSTSAGSSANPSLQVTVNNQFKVLGANGTLPIGSWTHLAGTYDGSVMRLYLNGAQDANTLSAPGSIGYGPSKEVVIGKDSLYASQVEPWYGLLDELRISTVARSGDWLATQYNNQSSPASFLFICGQAANGAQLPPCSVSLPGSFAFSRAIVISHANVPNTDQTDFPVLISGVFPYLANVQSGGEVQNPNGYDIAFSSDAAGQNRLDHEVDTYDPLTGTANFWVRIPTLSHTTDTTLYVWYGSSAVLDPQEYRPGVWRNGYAAVWHFGNGSNLSLADSTGVNNGTSAINVSAYPSTKIGGGAYFNGSSNTSIDIPNNPQIKPTSALTLEGWIYPYSLGNWAQLFGVDYRTDGTWTSPYQSYYVGSQNPAKAMLFGITAANGSDAQINGARTIPTSQWTHVVGTFDGSTLRLYENGVAEQTTVAAAGPILYGTSKDLVLGNDSKYQTCCPAPWYGLLDELRISAVARSADWIATEYNNQNSPATFYSIGSESANFGALNPVINWLTPDVGRPGMLITISGSGFGETQGSGTVTFNGAAALVNQWSYGTIKATVPANASSGLLTVTTTQQTSAQVPYTILPRASLKTVDIGSVPSAGSSSLTNGVYTVATSGADMWGTADSGTFLYQEWSGDFDVMVRVTSQQNTNGWAKAGIMVRENLSAGAKDVFAFMTPSNGARIQWRMTQGGGETLDTGVASAQPFYWIRLMRRGNAFAGLGSPDGQQWFALGSQSVPMASDIYVGIAQSTGGGPANTATYDNYSANSSAFPPGWAETDIGNVATPGVSVFDGTSFFIHTTGQEIWNGSDAGAHFIFQPWTGDFDLKVHVDFQQNSGAWAKFGLMVSESLAPNAANVVTFISPVNGSRMQWRLSTNAGEADEPGIPTAPVPSWVRLIRRGNNFSSYWSPDGSTWTMLGAKTVNLVSNVYLGLVATNFLTSWAGDVADSLQVVSPSAPAAVQSPWVEADVGSVPAPGSSSFDGLSTVVLSTGYDFWSPPDQFHYIYQSVPGDLDVVARVSYIENTGQWAKTGLMVRQSLDPAAANFCSNDTFSNGLRPQWRYTSGAGSSDEASAPGAVRPYWIRTVRRGNTFWSYGSANGISWTPLAKQNVAMTGSVLVGMATTTWASGGTTNNSTFDSLAVRATNLTATVPLVTSVSPASAGPLTQLNIQGSGFGTSTGSVQINGVPAPVVSWSAATITVSTPQPAPSGSVVVVAADGTLSNSDVQFAGLNPVVASVNPSSGSPGDRVTVYGSGFGAQQGSLTFNGTAAPILNWQNDHVVAYVPAGAQTGPVQATQSGINSNNNINFTVVAPQGTSSGVIYGYDALGRLTSVIDNSSGQAAVYNYDAVGNILSIARSSTGGSPAIGSFSPPSGSPQTEVTISGINFSATPSQNTVSFNGTAATVYRSTATTLVVAVPAGATTGPITVTTSAGSSTSSASFTVKTATPAPVIYSVTPNIASAGTTITITGVNFDPTPANDHLMISGLQITPASASPTSLTFTIPNNMGPGILSLSTPNGYTSAPGDFFVVPPGYAASSVVYASRISSSSTITVPIPAVGQIGLLIFDGIAGHNIAVNTLASTFSACNWQLFRSDELAFSAQAGCTTANPFLDAQLLPLNGTYTFVVAPANTAGSATLQFLDSVNLSGTIPTDGTPWVATTTVPGQDGLFTFVAANNSHLMWYLTSTSFAATPTCTMTIYNPQGSQYNHLTGNGVLSCNSGASTWQDLWYTPPGTYTLRLEPGGTTTGSVTLNLTNVPDVTGTISINGGAVQLTTTAGGQNGYLSFSGTSGQKITLSATSSYSGASVIFTLVRVSDSSNVTSFTTSGTASQSGITLPSTDNYRVFIDPQGLATGSATVTITSP
jgi:YD repeat-containing protein